MGQSGGPGCGPARHNPSARWLVWPSRQIAVLVVFALLCGLSVACSAFQKKANHLPEGVTAKGSPLDVDVAADGSLKAEVPSVGTLEGGPGSVTKGATVHVTPVAISRPPNTVDDVEIGAMGTGILVQVEKGRVNKALAVTFQTGPAGGDPSSLVALHRGDDGRWQLLPATLAADGRLAVETDHFSIVSWAVSKILKPIGDFMAAKLAGRTQPSKCDGAPAWASADGSPSGSTHACIRAGKPLSDGTVIAELEIKSNRGAYQWVDLPSGMKREYVWVEDESDLARAMIRKAFQRGESILLPPGTRMTVGYRQPGTPAQLRFRTYVDTLSGALTIGRLAVDAATDDTVDKTGGYLAVLSCFGILKIDLTNLNSPAQLQNPELLTSLIPCVVKQVKSFHDDPAKVVGAARDLLGSEVDGQALTSLSQDLFKLGRYATLFLKAIELGTYIFKELGFITDALTAGFGAANGTNVTLTLGATSAVESQRPGPTGVPVQYVKQWGRHGQTLTVRPDGTGMRSSRTYSEPNSGQNMYYELDTTAFTISADGGTLLGTVSAVRFADSAGTPLPPQPTSSKVGDTYAYFLKPNGALNEHQVQPPAPNGGEDLAYCVDGVQDLMCGA